MKKLRFLLVILPLFGCQRILLSDNKGYSNSHALQVMGSESASSVSGHKNIGHLNTIKPSQRLKGKPEAGEYYYQDVHLITHGRFAFIAFLDHEISADTIVYTDISDQFELYSSSCVIYAINDHEKVEAWKTYLEKEYQVADHDRSQANCKVLDVVVVDDHYSELPYVAAVLDISATDGFLYYGWTSRKGSITYPFMLNATYFEDQAREDILVNFQNSVEFSRFEESLSSDFEEDYRETVTYEYEHFSGVKYYVVQTNLMGDCNSLLENLTAVYVEKNGRTDLIAMDTLDYYLHDLIDIDGDGFPEFFGAEFSASAIFKIADGRFTLLHEINWTTTECPC